MVHSSRLPIVDVGSFFEAHNGDEQSRGARKDAADALFAAFATAGMAYLRFDGSSNDMLKKSVQPSFREAERFFRRSLPEKQTATVDGLPQGVTRGYLRTGAESGATTFEWKEAFSWSFDWDQTHAEPQNSLEARNVWPVAPSGTDISAEENMKDSFNSLFAFMGKVMVALVDALLEAWPTEYGSVPDLHTLSKQGDTISLLRSFHYYGTNDSSANMTGSCEHTDWGFATLIAQQESGGAALQVHVDGMWADVPPVPDTLVVNCSDFLSLLTDGRLHSPLHRVVLTENDRISFVYFQYPGFDTPVPCISEGGKKRTKGLFLLKNQSDESAGSGKQNTAASRLKDLTFGELIAMKWQQVSRS